MKPFRKPLAELLTKVKRHNSRIRVPIIHGYLAKYESRTTAVTFVKIDGGGDKHSVGELTGTAADLRKAVVVLSDLSVQIANVMEKLANAFPISFDNHDNSSGNISK